MREFKKILMIIIITLSFVNIVLDIRKGTYSEIWNQFFIAILCLQILGYIGEIKKLEKEKVTILRINNRGDEE